jgi:lysyl-tRNA synthetase class 1
MFWCDQLLKKINLHEPQLINDSKTPSGRAHVGALRGVIIHDVIFKVLKEKGIPVHYRFGVDDYDPLDELPYGKDQQFEPYLGMPLCKVPPPPGTNASDMAEYYINEFFEVFDYLGVTVEKYRMRDIYQSGQFDEVINSILQQAATVRRVYKEVSNSERSANWYPFQVICEQCGRLGTTEVTNYDGKEVTYTCRPDLVKWAKGCGYQGKMSPFSGNGKLPWKLEWVAKWKTFGITIEGAGKDHTTKGGSRDVATHCLKEIFRQKPPLNIPYEFFLVGGAKMSSSRGIGAAAKEMADFLSPEILRFLMIRPQPHKPINFPVDEDNIVKLFNEFDRYQRLTYQDPQVSEEIKRTYLLSEITPEGDYFNANLQLIEALVQMPHLEPLQEVEKRKGSVLTPIELTHLQRRIDTVKYWLANYATEEEKLQLQDTLPARANELSIIQRGFLWCLAQELPFTPWEEEVLQSTIFRMSRLTPIPQLAAFQAIYRVLFNRDSGPKAGNLFVFLDRDFIVQRFKELSFSATDFWRATGIPLSEFEAWLEKNKSDITNILAGIDITIEDDNEWVGIIEFFVTLKDQKTYMHRTLFLTEEDFKITAPEQIENVARRHQLAIQHTPSPWADLRNRL